MSSDLLPSLWEKTGNSPLERNGPPRLPPFELFQSTFCTMGGDSARAARAAARAAAGQQGAERDARGADAFPAFQARRVPLEALLGNAQDGAQAKSFLEMRIVHAPQCACLVCARKFASEAEVRQHVDSCLQAGQDAGQPAAFDPPRPEQGGSSADAGSAETGQTNTAGAPGGAPRARAKGWVTWKENGKIMLAERQGAPSSLESDDEDCEITAVTHVSDPVASLDLCQVCGGHSLSCFACRLRCTARRRFPLSSINDRSKRTRTKRRWRQSCGKRRRAR